MKPKIERTDIFGYLSVFGYTMYKREIEKRLTEEDNAVVTDAPVEMLPDYMGTKVNIYV
jgi:hypothetical protein